MALKLYQFINDLISNESSRTIIQTIVNLFLARTVSVTDDDGSLASVKQFYDKMASTLGLQYGNILLATSTNAQLKSTLESDWPFFGDSAVFVEKCLVESKCDELQNIFSSLGNPFLVLFDFCKSISLCREYLERAVPPSGTPDPRQGRQSSSLCTCSLLLLPRGEQPPWKETT